MTCDQVCDRLSDYLDDELSSPELRELEDHLKRCASCEAEHDALRTVLRLLALHGSQRAPRDCVAPVLARLPAAPPSAGKAGFRIADFGFWILEHRLRTAHRWRPSPNPKSAIRNPKLSWMGMSAAGAALAVLVIASIQVAPLVIDRGKTAAITPPPARPKDALRRDSSRLLQALGREDGYLLAMESGEDGR